MEISLIIPVYNVESLLPRCLDSLLNQTFSDFELILIDDGATDNSGKICDDYAVKDARIKVKHITNGGQSAARNLGMKLVTGRYIGFIDSDDFVARDYLKSMHDLIAKFDVDVAGCKSISYSEALKKSVEQMEKERNSFQTHLFEGNHSVVKEFLKEQRFTWTPWAKLFRAELCTNIRFELNREFEDSYFDYQIFVKSNKVASVDYIGYYYFVNTESKTRIPFYRAQFDMVTEEHKILAHVQSNYPDLIQLEVNNLALRYYWLYSKLFNENVLSQRVRAISKDLRKLYQADQHYFKEITISRKYRIFLSLTDHFPLVVAVLNKLYRTITKRRAQL